MLPTLLLQPPEDQLHNIAETLTYYTCMFISDRHLVSSEFIMGPKFQFKTKNDCGETEASHMQIILD